MMFSATSTQKIEDLAHLALKKEPVVVGVEDVVEKATVEGLEQGFFIHLCASVDIILHFYIFL